MGKFASALKAGQTMVDLTNNAKDLAGAASNLRQADKGEMGRQAGRAAFSEGADVGKTMGKTWLKTFEVVPRLVCRGLQFLFALIACGFYGNRVDADRQAAAGFSPEWIFAILVAGLSAVTSLAFLGVATLGALPVVGSRLKVLKTYRAFAWDGTLFVCWLVVFGIFAGIFLRRDDDDGQYKGASTGAMKTAVWVDLVNVLFWLATLVYGAVKTFLGDKVDSLSEKAGDKLFTKKDKVPAEKTKDNYAESV